MMKLKKSTDFNTIYVCTAWSGHRRLQDRRYQLDNTFYLKTHIENLKKYKHNLNHIVFAISHNPTETSNYKEFVKNIPKKIQKANVEILYRENIGLSYGALSDVFRKYQTNYDYYFTIEDDYSFIQDNFDKIFIHKLLQSEKYAYVTCLAGAVYADISVGVIKSKALKEFANSNNGVLYPYPWNARVNHTNYDSVYQYGQFNTGVALRKLGYEIVDLRENYKCAFRDPKPFPNNLRWFFADKKETIVLPI